MVIAVLLAVPAAPLSAATPRTFYVDCAGGNDAYAGTSTSQAWRTLPKANGASLSPGDALLLKRGCTWTGPLKAVWTGNAALPIRIGAYGSGELPRIQNARDNVDITGSYLIIENLFTRADAPSYDSGCANARAGWRVGFRFRSGASYNTLRYSQANELYHGILLGSGTHHNRVLNNTLRNNNMKSEDPDSDAGGNGIVIAGDDNEIAYNDVSGSDVCSRWFSGRDGAAFEVYGGQRNVIHHNSAWDNNNFLELGNSRSADTTVAYNRVTSSLRLANFLVTRGSGSSYGPVARTSVYNNSAYLTGSESYAIQCTGGCGPSILTFKNNIVWSQDRIGYADAAFDEGNNIYWRSDGAPKVWFPTSSSSRKVDPRFASPSTRDLHVTSASPAIDRGTMESVSRGFVTDMDGEAVPSGNGVDIGVDERAVASVAPAPAPTTLARDAFGRSIADGWGSADVGGRYALIGPASDYDVVSGVGTIRVSGPGVSSGGLLTSVRTRDVDSTFRVRTDRAPTGSGQYAYLAVRRVDSLTEYRIKLRFASSGAVFVQGSRVTGGRETTLGTEVSAGFTHSPGSFVWVRAQITGANPTTLRIRAWRDGSTQPSSWQYTQADSTAALQQSGDMGLRVYVSSGAERQPVTYGFDDWVVTTP